jgi:hypothetical protein
MIYLSIPFGIHEDREQTPGAVLRVQIQGKSGFLQGYIPEHFLETLEEVGAFRENYRRPPSVHLYPETFVDYAVQIVLHPPNSRSHAPAHPAM